MSGGAAGCPARDAHALVTRLVLVGLLGLVACSAGTQRRGAAGGNAVIPFDCPVADVEVWVDGRYLEGALRRGVAVKAGTHRVEIRHDDYHTFFAELEVTGGERRVLEVRLAEILPLPELRRDDFA